MRLRIVKVDTAGIETQLARIADALEGLRESTNPAWVAYGGLPEDDTPRTFYTDEEQQIVEEKLARMGRQYKPR